jgi:nitrite reductase/ring-hydroxylating ferredoxin subunit
VLLASKDGEVFAPAHKSFHSGTTFSRALLPDSNGRCPWHGSAFPLAGGRLLAGLATEPPPDFNKRVTNGQIEMCPF